MASVRVRFSPEFPLGVGFPAKQCCSGGIRFCSSGNKTCRGTLVHFQSIHGRLSSMANRKMPKNLCINSWYSSYLWNTTRAKETGFLSGKFPSLRKSEFRQSTSPRSIPSSIETHSPAGASILRHQRHLTRKKCSGEELLWCFTTMLEKTAHYTFIFEQK
jgi:hypothetical protein